jgi:diguanylate cyclase (GGDEF)-like protein
MTSVTFCFAIGYVWDQGAGWVTQALAILVASIAGWRGFWRTSFDIGRYCLALVAAVAAAALLGRQPLTEPKPADLAYVALVALAWYVTLRLVTATGNWLLEGGRWTRALLDVQPGEVLSAVALVSLVLLVGTTRGQVWLVALALAPIVAVSQLTLLYLRLQKRGKLDQLTGLPNRLGLEHSAEEPIRIIAKQGGRSTMAALLTVDVVQLGRVNDALGRRFGDDILVAVGGRLETVRGPEAMVARLGGDKFGVFMWPLADSAEVLARAANVRDLFSEPLSVNGFPLLVSVTVGASLCPVHATSFDALARYADAATEHAKLLPNRIAIYEPDRGVPTAEELALLADLGRALDEPDSTEIVPFYQPQVERPRVAHHRVRGLARRPLAPSWCGPGTPAGRAHRERSDEPGKRRA